MKLASSALTLVLLQAALTTVLPTRAQAVPDPTRQLDATESQSIVDKYKNDLAQLGCRQPFALSGTERGGGTPSTESRYIEINAAETKGAAATLIIRVSILRAPNNSSVKIECEHSHGS